MLAFLHTIFWILFRRLLGPTIDETDVAALRHQVVVLQRQLGRRPKLTRWHRAGFRLLWKNKSRGKAGRPRVDVEVRRLIRRISAENPLWGAPRIHGELLKLGINVCQSTVAKYMVRG